jgi:Mn-containing catalase
MFCRCAAEQKARVTYDNLLRLIDDPDVCDPIKFLRAREVVHYQRFGEGKLPNYTDFNPSKSQKKLIRNFH